MSTTVLRLFIALELPATQSEQLAAVQSQLKATQHGVKWVEPRGMHLTMQFLGDTPLARVGDLRAALSRAVHGVTPFKLYVEGLGGFPDLKRPRVIWAGLGGDLDALFRLNRQLLNETGALGFEGDGKLIQPHLTLGRVREGADRNALLHLGQAVSATSLPAGEPWKVESLHLIKSELRPSGPIYSHLVTQRLVG
jgi:2'-5' RNA ligase